MLRQPLHLDSLPDPGSTYVLSAVRPRRGYRAFEPTSIDRPTHPAMLVGRNGSKGARDLSAARRGNDNFEHLMAGAPELGTLLSNVPRLEGKAMRWRSSSL